MLDITITGRVTVDGDMSSVIRLLRKDNQKVSPTYERLQRMGLSTWKTPRIISTLEGNEVHCTFPIEYLPVALVHFKEAGLAYSITYNTTPQFNSATGDYDRTQCAPVVDMQRKAELWNKLYPYQRAAVSAMVGHRRGILVSPTGSGKSLMGAAIIAHHNLPTIVLVHTSGLLNQMREELSKWLDIDVGIIGNGKRIDKPVIVGMVQTVSRMETVDPFFKKFGLVMQDECHHVALTMFTDTLQRFNSLFRIGLSATPYRKDGLQDFMFRCIGKVKATVDTQDVINTGKIIWPEHIMIPTNFRYQINTPTDYGDMLTWMSQDETRNRLIASHVAGVLTQEQDAKVLVLCDRIAHAKNLAKLMPSAVLLHGKLRRKELAAAWDVVKAGANLTIATTHLVGEGIDVKAWDTLFLASPITVESKFMQCIGRITRAKEGKSSAVVYDFVDLLVDMLAKMYHKRKAIFESKGEMPS